MLKRLSNPATLVALLTAVVSCVVAFGVDLTQAQSNSVLVFGGSIAVILFAHGITNFVAYLTPEAIVGLVSTAVGTAVAFGLNLTGAQQTDILTLTGVVASIFFVHGAVTSVVALKAKVAGGLNAGIRLRDVDPTLWGSTVESGSQPKAGARTGLGR